MAEVWQAETPSPWRSNWSPGRFHLQSKISLLRAKVQIRIRYCDGVGQPTYVLAFPPKRSETIRPGNSEPRTGHNLLQRHVVRPLSQIRNFGARLRFCQRAYRVSGPVYRKGPCAQSGVALFSIFHQLCRSTKRRNGHLALLRPMMLSVRQGRAMPERQIRRTIIRTGEGRR